MAVTGKDGNYEIIVDDTTTANMIYIGKAPRKDGGNVTSDAVWQIKRVNLTSGVIVTWADGSDIFEKVWDDRVGYSW